MVNGDGEFRHRLFAGTTGESFYNTLILKSIMKTLTFLIMIILTGLVTPVSASPEKRIQTLDVLKKEVVQLFQKNVVQYPDISDQQVTVGFLINAKGELIILDVNGDSDAACEYVKEVLNYKKVKYNQAEQLTMYTITFHLVKE